MPSCGPIIDFEYGVFKRDHVGPVTRETAVKVYQRKTAADKHVAKHFPAYVVKVIRTETPREGECFLCQMGLHETAENQR